MAGLDPVSLELLTWAKRAAIAEGRSVIVPRDLACGVYALAHEGKLADQLKALFGGAPGPTAWDRDIATAYKRASLVSAEQAAGRRLDFNDSVQGLINRTHSKSPELDVSLLLAELARAGGEFVSFLAEGVKLPVSVEPGMTTALFGVLDRVDRLVGQLNQEVLGQEAAVSMLGQAYFQACVAPRKNGPRGIFTFLGPSGVGKTMLAECFARALVSFEGEEHAFRRFDMGSFGGHQNFEQLFGAESFYQGSRPGTLTGLRGRASAVRDPVRRDREGPRDHQAGAPGGARQGRGGGQGPREADQLRAGLAGVHDQPRAASSSKRRTRAGSSGLAAAWRPRPCSTCSARRARAWPFTSARRRARCRPSSCPVSPRAGRSCSTAWPRATISSWSTGA